MGTWRSATPRGQFGAQAGGTIFTSSRPVSPTHWLRGTGFKKGTTLCQGPSSPRAALVTLMRGGGMGSVPQSPPPPWYQSQGPPHPGLSQTFVSSFTQPGTKATKIELAPHLHDPSPRSDEIYLHLHQAPTPGLQLQVGLYTQLRNSTLPLLPPPQPCQRLPLSSGALPSPWPWGDTPISFFP